MKLNVILPWVIVLGLGAATAAVYTRSAAKDSQISSLRQQVAALEPLQAEVEELRAGAAISQDQVLVPKKDKEELIKLRGEVGGLRDQVKKLEREVALARNNVDAAKSETARALQEAQSNALAVASMRTAAQLPRTQPAQNNCINNLRQLDGAKQQWALENSKTVESIPQPQEVAVYLPGNAIPACPEGGVYTLNDVGHVPTCSIPAHRLQ